MPPRRNPPLAEEVRTALGPADLFAALGGPERPGSLLLESARAEGASGRWSFVLTEPFLVFRSRGAACWTVSGGKTARLQGGPFEALRRLMAPFAMKRPAGFPPFAGGAAGVLAYELKNRIERPAAKVRDPYRIPDTELYFYDRGAAFDHAERRAVAFVAHGGRRALDAWRRRIAAAHLPGLGPAPDPVRTGRGGTRWRDGAMLCQRVPAASPAGPGPVQPAPDLERNRAAFLANVRRVKERIRRGDVFQVNLSHALEFPFEGDLFALYRAQTRLNPTPFAAYARMGDYRLLCGSPERLLRVEGRSVATRPIAGTRPRSGDPELDSHLRAELVLSPKERAEHVMLVDLERNDLGRVAAYGSVRVDELMAVETYSHVRHIVSNVRARLDEGRDAFDALRAVFPGGTITGAPKVRAMQLIDALERRARGPYTGSLGWIGFDGDCDFNIIIRSLIAKDGRAWLPVGAGIVADSEPEREYAETLDKAQALLQVLRDPAPAPPEPVASA